MKSDEDSEEVYKTPVSDEPFYSPTHLLRSDGASNSLWEPENTVIRISSFEESISASNVLQKPSTSNPQKLDPSSAYKTSKTRRSEYSMRGTMGQCSNPSQDSAFGSMTDGECSRASSFKLSSFQSISSPIGELDEGVEDILENKLPIENSCVANSQLENFTRSLHNLDSNVSPNSGVHAAAYVKETYSELPRLMVNDDNYVFTSSPIRKCGLNDPFGQKLRVSSFDNLSISSNAMRDACKKQSRSFEEEQRIETAFTPLSNVSYDNQRNTDQKKQNIVLSNSTNKLSVISRDNFTKKTSVRKYDNESHDLKQTKIEYHDELDSGNIGEPACSFIQRRIRTDRTLFSLSKFKQNAIAESITFDTSSDSSSAHETTKKSNSSNECDDSNIQNTTVTSTINDEFYSDGEESSSLSESLLKTPSIEDVRKFVNFFDSEDKSNASTGSGEEAAPLLGIEMQSLSSSTDPE